MYCCYYYKCWLFKNMFQQPFFLNHIKRDHMGFRFSLKTSVLRHVFFQVLCMSLLIVSFAVTVNAQQVPGSALPGQRIKQFEEKPSTPLSTMKALLPRMEGQKVPKEAESVSLTLTAVNIIGATVYNDDDFKPFYVEYLGKKITGSVLFEIATKITAMYDHDGYGLSRAVVPRQEFDKEDAILTIEVIEGYVDEVEYKAVDKNGKELLNESGEPQTVKDVRGFF